MFDEKIGEKQQAFFWCSNYLSYGVLSVFTAVPLRRDLAPATASFSIRCNALPNYLLHEPGDSNTCQGFWRPPFYRLNYARLLLG